MDELLVGLDPAEVRAVAILRAALDRYNRGEGTGLLAGATRYAALHDRARLAAYAARDLPAFWSRLCRLMLWPPPPVADDAAILALVAGQDPGFGRRVLAALADNTMSVLMLARLAHATARAERVAGATTEGGTDDHAG